MLHVTLPSDVMVSKVGKCEDPEQSVPIHPALSGDGRLHGLDLVDVCARAVDAGARPYIDAVADGGLAAGSAPAESMVAIGQLRTVA